MIQSLGLRHGKAPHALHQNKMFEFFPLEANNQLHSLRMALLSKPLFLLSVQVCGNFLLLPLFVDLIIGEAIGPPSPDRSFLHVHIASLMPWRLDNKGNNIHSCKILFLFMKLYVLYIFLY